MQTRILVVDDDEPTRQWLRRGLSRRGYEVTVAHNPASARIAARRRAPNWAIIDQRLTRAFVDGSGLDLADELLAADPCLRVLIHTGYATIAAALRAGRRSRIVDYLEKPVTIDEICAKIEGRSSERLPKPATLDDVQHAHAMRVLVDHHGNLTRAATALGVSREALRRKLAR